MAEYVAKLGSNISSEEEVLTLQQLHSALSAINHNSGSDHNLTGVAEHNIELFGEGNPYHTASVNDLCPSQAILDRFTCYVFERRFGWSETDTEDGRRVRHMSCSGATMSAGSSKQKSALNTMLDCLLKWFLHQEMDLRLLQALKYTIAQTSNLPVVRNRAVIHSLDWFKLNHESLCDDTVFKQIHDVVVLSVTDVWSAIRNAATSRLSHISAAFNIHHVQQLFESLVKICEKEESWQKKEGAIMGINAILQRFLNRSSPKSPMSSPRVLDAEKQERAIPEFISGRIQSVVFDLLSHSQLTIREHAAKTLATYITCSSVDDAISTLNDVVQILRSYSKNTEVPIGLVMLLQSHSGKFVDDYAAEGFLGVCIFLVKVIPLSCLLPSWPEYISTFLLYLSHPASTVRQAASSVFKYLVVKSSHSVVILKLLLQALAMGWSPDTDAMTQECEPQSTSVGKPSPSVCQYTGSNLSDSWEGREGRMFAYELIFRYLIKNHWLYTFGPAGAGLHSDPAVSKDGPGGVSDHADVKNSTENELLSSTPNQFGMHHVESEKSLAVRFLTQTELKEDTGIVTHAGGRLGRLQSTETDQLSRSPHMSHSPGAGLGGGAGLPGGMGLAQYDLSCSLLTQAQLLEGAWQGAESNPAHTGVDRQETQLRRLSQLLENNNNRNSMCRCGWMEKEYLQDMSRILKVILYQTAECLGHAQWELRRIANQVLPCLGEVIRWYDINLLVSVWNSYLNVAMPTCLMTFTSVLLLKESVIHAVKLLPLLHKPPHSWQDPERCRECLSQITGTVKHRVSAYLPHLQFLVSRLSCDRLSVQAADVILMAYEHLRITSDKKFQHVHTVLKMWREIFHGAHPQTRISLELLHTDPSQPFQSPFEGYLSCCLVKPDNKTQCAKQVEKHLVTEMYNRFSVFVSSLPVEDRLSVTPILAHYIGQFEEDTHISKAMLDCLQSHAGDLMKYHNEHTSEENRAFVTKCVLSTLRELAAVITLKSVELSQIQRVLSIYGEVCPSVCLSQHLPTLLSGIAARLNETVEFSLHVETPAYQVGGENEDLSLLSNDIPATEPPSVDTSDSEEDLHAVGSPSKRFRESLTLNTSNNSGSLSGRLSSLSAHSVDGEGSVTPEGGSGDEETSSDWDSWDEEEEGQSAFGDTFAVFLGKLQKSSTRDFQAELKQLPIKQRTVILNLLKN
ncbi:uncharacterized protein LOC128244975 isoform X2 [Mya arenaria]|uniref:uncharacterized protein LOC128244975 isoform X2 n=1 Tax=Mya arenaria TaxID=6604 RepID=UPI0022E98E6C|nr:uncharacterized protein LOC128244975 isoform X2 [Mya arenaria]